MKTIARALITTIIIVSAAIVAGDQKARINLAVQSVSEVSTSVLQNVRSYQLDESLSADQKYRPLQKVASRKKTVARSA